MILGSLRSESAVDAKHCRLQPVDMEHHADIDEMLAYMDEDEEDESGRPTHPSTRHTTSTRGYLSR